MSAVVSPTVLQVTIQPPPYPPSSVVPIATSAYLAVLPVSLVQPQVQLVPHAILDLTFKEISATPIAVMDTTLF